MRIQDLPQPNNIREIKIKKTIKESFIWDFKKSDHLYDVLLDNNNLETIKDHFLKKYKQLADCYPINFNQPSTFNNVKDLFDKFLKKYDFHPDWENSTIAIHKNGAYTIAMTFTNKEKDWGVWAEQSNDSLENRHIQFGFGVGVNNEEDLKIFEKDLRGTLLAITQCPPF